MASYKNRFFFFEFNDLLHDKDIEVISLYDISLQSATEQYFFFFVFLPMLLRFIAIDKLVVVLQYTLPFLYEENLGLFFGVVFIWVFTSILVGLCFFFSELLLSLVQSFKNALIVSINFFDVVFSFYLVILFLNVVLYFSNISFVLGSIWFENSDIIREYFFANAQFSFFYIA
jgi:hypothetical protein